MKMTSQPLLAQSTQNKAKALTRSNAHSFIINGDRAGNAETVAVWFAEQLKTAQTAVHVIEENPLSIGAVRDLRVLASQRGNKELRSIIVLAHADTLPIEAQNALLKALEEPAEGVSYVLGVNNFSVLLRTIVSRSSVLVLDGLQMPDLEDYYGNRFSSQELKMALTASDGSATRLEQYLNSEHTEAMDKAKKIVAAKPFARLLMVSEFDKKREEAIEVVHSMQSIYRFLLEKSINDTSKTATMLQNIENTQSTIEDLRKNAHIKLTLDRLFLAL